MNKQEYIDAITKLLEQCNNEALFSYIQSFLENQVQQFCCTQDL